MNVENAASRPGSGTTSTAAPEGDVARLTESAYLSQQAVAARAAMARAAHEMKASLAKGANPVAWAHAHPWIGVGAGAVAGFVAAVTLVPSKEEQALRRLRRIEAALNPNKPSHEENGNSNGHGKEHKGWIGLILKELLGVVGPLLANVLNSQIPPGAATDPQSADPQGSSNASV